MTAGATSPRSPAARRPSVLAHGFAYVESPRWHDGRLWFAHWGTGEIVAVDLDGTSEVVGQGRPGLGWSIDWLPDGRLLLTGEELSRQEPDGSLVRHVDLRSVADFHWNEIVVDGRENIYVNGINFDFLGGSAPRPGIIVLVTPDGSTRQVADGIEFPNGMVVTPDNSTLIIAESFAGRLTAFEIDDDGSLSNRRVWAEGFGPDGICLDADGAIWTHAPATRECVRVREGGGILDRISLDRDCFACMLGGPDRLTLFALVAEWRGTEHVADALAARTGQILVAPAPAAGAGWP